MMEQNNSSLENEIKKFEETLSRDPSSYCFAPLAELHRKSGQIDAAIAVAEKGIATHPDYVGGHLALGRAYLEKQMLPEARRSLEKVVNLTPENLLAHKLLSQIYLSSGENSHATETLKFLVANNPADNESRFLLDSLKETGLRSAVSPQEFSSAPASSFGDLSGWDTDAEDDSEDILELELIEDTEMLEDLPASYSGDLAQDREIPQLVAEGSDADAEADQVRSGDEVRIKTATLAEIFAGQGHIAESVGIYKELVSREPLNSNYAARLEELEASPGFVVTTEEHPEGTVSDTNSPGDIPELSSIESFLPSADLDEYYPPVVAQGDAFAHSYNSETEIFVTDMPEDPGALSCDEPDLSVTTAERTAGGEIDPVATLTNWLENIRRIRACHSEKS
jgi:tetratricopeptide (TPR) repeat protein